MDSEEFNGLGIAPGDRCMVDVSADGLSDVDRVGAAVCRCMEGTVAASSPDSFAGCSRVGCTVEEVAAARFVWSCGIGVAEVGVCR